MLEPKPSDLLFFEAVKIWLTASHVLNQKDGFERDDGDLLRMGLAPVLASLHGGKLHPRQIQVAFVNGVILSCFGMSQVLLVIFFLIFSVSCS